MQQKIFTIRDQKVMLDYQLAELYEVPTKRLNEAVKRNLARFPKHYMFQLKSSELDDLRSQFATANALSLRIHKSRELPYAFTEHGILMLASVLKSERAVQVSIALVDVFVKLREHLSDPLNLRVDRLEKESILVMKLFDDILKRLHVIEGEGLPSPKKKIGI